MLLIIHPLQLTFRIVFAYLSGFDLLASFVKSKYVTIFNYLQLFCSRWGSSVAHIPWKEVESKMFALNMVSGSETYMCFRMKFHVSSFHNLLRAQDMQKCMYTCPRIYPRRGRGIGCFLLSVCYRQLRHSIWRSGTSTQVCVTWLRPAGFQIFLYFFQFDF